METQARFSFSSILVLFFFSEFICKRLKTCVPVFSGSTAARILELCICMDEKFLYQGIDNQADCYYYALYYPFFCLFKKNLCHSFHRNYLN